jgi:hypothetical protein
VVPYLVSEGLAKWVAIGGIDIGRPSCGISKPRAVDIRRSLGED